MVSEYVAVVLLLAVGLVTLMGISVMVGGTKDEARESERLMEWRIGLQAAAVLLLVLGSVFFF